jgi:hypothetical protein
MRKTIVLACALALGGIAATPAFADCQEDIKSTEEATAKTTDAKQKAEAQKHIDLAKAELDKANEKACTEHVTAAKTALKHGY